MFENELFISNQYYCFFSMEFSQVVADLYPGPWLDEWKEFADFGWACIGL